MKENFVDEFRLYVYPLLLGTGKRLFEEGISEQTLKLVNARIFASGCIQSTYATTLSYQNQ